MSGGEAPNGVPTANGVSASPCPADPGPGLHHHHRAGRRRGQRRPQRPAGCDEHPDAGQRLVRPVRGRAVQLQRRPGGDPGQQCRRPHAVQPGEHRDHPHQGHRGRGSSQDQPDQARLRPRGHHGRQPGRRRSRHRLQHRGRQVGLRAQRHADLRRRPCGRLHHRVHRPRRQGPEARQRSGLHHRLHDATSPRPRA